MNRSNISANFSRAAPSPDTYLNHSVLSNPNHRVEKRKQSSVSINDSIQILNKKVMDIENRLPTNTEIDTHHFDIEKQMNIYNEQITDIYNQINTHQNEVSELRNIISKQNITINKMKEYTLELYHAFFQKQMSDTIDSEINDSPVILKVSDVSCLPTDQSEVVSEQSEVVSEQSEVVPDQSEVVPDQSEVVSEQSEVVPDQSEVVHDQSEVVTDVNTIRDTFKNISITITNGDDEYSENLDCLTTSANE